VNALVQVRSRIFCMQLCLPTGRAPALCASTACHMMIMAPWSDELPHKPYIVSPRPVGKLAHAQVRLLEPDGMREADATVAPPHARPQPVFAPGTVARDTGVRAAAEAAYLAAGGSAADPADPALAAAVADEMLDGGASLAALAAVRAAGQDGLTAAALAARLAASAAAAGGSAAAAATASPAQRQAAEAAAEALERYGLARRMPGWDADTFVAAEHCGPFLAAGAAPAAASSPSAAAVPAAGSSAAALLVGATSTPSAAAVPPAGGSGAAAPAAMPAIPPRLTAADLVPRLAAAAPAIADSHGAAGGVATDSGGPQPMAVDVPSAAPPSPAAAAAGDAAPAAPEAAADATEPKLEPWVGRPWLDYEGQLQPDMWRSLSRKALALVTRNPGALSAPSSVSRINHNSDSKAQNACQLHSSQEVCCVACGAVRTSCQAHAEDWYAFSS